MARKRRALTAQQKTVRRQRRAAKTGAAPAAKQPAVNPLLDPSQPLAGQNLLDAARGSVDVATGPQIASLDRQARSTAAQGGALAGVNMDVYKKLAEQEAQRVDTQRAIADKLNQSQAGVAQGAQDAIAKTGETVSGELGQDAALRGQGLAGDAVQRLAAERQAQSGVAAQQGQAAGSAAASQGANYAGFQTAMAGAHGARGAELTGQAMNRLASQLADIGGKRQTVEASRGPLLADTISKLRQQGFEDIVTQLGLGIKKEDLAAQTQNQQTQAQLAAAREAEAARANRARERQAARATKTSAATQRRGQDVTARGQDLSAQTQRRGQDISASKKGRGGPASSTPSSRRDAQNSLDKARSIVGILKSANKINSGNRATTAAGLAATKGIPRPLADAAVQIAMDGGADPRLARSIKKRFGISVPVKRQPTTVGAAVQAVGQAIGKI